jgi:hypothetical protein
LPPLDSPSTLVLVFADRSLEEDPEPLQEVQASFPTAAILGCSTSGQIVGDRLRDGICTVAVMRFDRVHLRKASAAVSAAEESFDAGKTLGETLAADDLRSVFVLSDGLNVNGSELVAGLVATTGPDVVMSGGLAGDGDRFERTWVIDDGARRENRVVAVGLYGEAVRAGAGSGGGWGIFGPDRIVTRSRSNVLYELDGRPALEIYKRYLGELASGLPATALLFPLAIRSEAGGEQLVRTVLAVDEADQSMTFAGDIPEGWRAQLMRSSADRLVDGASSAARESGIGLPVAPGPSLAIAISCVGRRLVLGERTEEEIAATLQALPEGCELMGFYSYGEIAPSARGFCDLHNQTMTITIFAEG